MDYVVAVAAGVAVVAAYSAVVAAIAFGRRQIRWLLLPCLAGPVLVLAIYLTKRLHEHGGPRMALALVVSVGCAISTLVLGVAGAVRAGHRKRSLRNGAG